MALVAAGEFVERAGRLPPKWAVIAAANAALDGMGPSPTMFFSMAGDMRDAAEAGVTVFEVLLTEPERGGGNGTPAGPLTGCER